MIVKNYKQFVQFLRNAGYTGSVNFAAFQFLVDQGYTSGHVNSRWFQFLRDLGYDGTLQEMMNDWVDNNFPGGGFTVSIGSGPFESGSLLTATVNGLEGGETVTYQWTDDGVNITGATSSTYTATIGVDGIADASAIGVTITVNGGDPITELATREIRYAEGSVTESLLGDWTIDDDTLNISFVSDFTTTNLTGSYVITGLGNGAVDDGDGTISGGVTGTPTTLSPIVTFTDQYGRTIVGNYSVDVVYRTQATATDGLGPFSWTVDDTTVNVNATTDFTTNGNTLTYTATGLPTGVTIATNGTISGTPTTASSGSIVITATDEYSRQTTSTTSHTTSLRTQATGGVDLDLSYPEDSAITPQNLLANWTANGNTLTFVSISPSLPTGLSINSSGVLSGTPTTETADNTYTLTMQDEYSRQTADTFTLQITAVASAVNPVISTANFTNTEDGTRDSLAVTGTYAGADTIDATLEFYEGLTLRATATVLGITVTTGNFNFSENIDPVDLTYDGASTAADMPNVDNIDVTIAERNNGGTATDNITGVTGLDVVAPTFSSAEIGTVDATSLIVTFSEAMRGSTTAADWDVQVNSSPATESAVAFTPGGTTADITLGAAVSNGDTVTVAYNGSGLTDEDGNALATFTAQSVTNNVAAGGGGITADHQGIYEVATATSGGSASTTVDIGAADAGREIFVAVYHDTDTGGVVSAITVNSVSLTEITQNVNWTHTDSAIDFSVRWFRGTVASGTGNVTMEYTSATGEVYQPLFSVWRVLGANATLDDTEGFSSNGTSETTPSFTTSLNGVTIGVIGMAAPTGLAFTGATQQGSTVQYTGNGQRNMAAFRETGNAAGTDTVGVTLTNAGNRTCALLSLAEA